MTRWIIWSFLLLITSGSGTLASRARNTPSYGYHSLAALGSHGTFFIQQLIGIDIIVEVIRTRSVSLAVTGFVVYATASTLGSVLSHWAAMKFFEKGNRRVGSYEDKIMTGTITTLIRKQEQRKRADGTADQGGYGFIRDEDGHDRFFHARDVVTPEGAPAQILFESLKEGTRVEFAPLSGCHSRTGTGNGLRADQVRVIV